MMLWLIHRMILLLLAVALVLPPAATRNCCCTRQAAKTSPVAQKLKPCCQARLKAAARKHEKIALRMQQPPCQCQPPVINTAVLAEAPHRMLAGLDLSLEQPVVESSLLRSAISPQTGAANGESGDAPGVSMHKSLCRWQI